MASTPRQPASLPPASQDAASALATQFDEHRRQLKADIRPLLLQEHRTDIDGEIHREHFCPTGAIETLFGISSICSKIRSLYRCSLAINPTVGPSLDEFCEIIWHRDPLEAARLVLAILVYLDTEVSSSHWICFLKSVGSGGLRDRHLPLRPTSSLLSRSKLGGAFGRRQYIFCPVVLESAERGLQRIVGHQTDRPFPYLVENNLGHGSAGTVYKVKLAKDGYSWARDNRTGEDAHWWARKDMELDDSREELKMATQLLQGGIDDKCLVKTLGSLRYSKETQSADDRSGKITEQVSLFFEPADLDLDKFMQTTNNGTFTLRLTLENVLGLVGALKYLHEGIISGGSSYSCFHLDVKPQNVLVFPKQLHKFKLADFSISKVQREEDRPMPALNHYTKFRGNDACLCVAPEATLKKPLISSRCDVWSLGCTMCLVLAWTFAGKRGVEELKAALRGSTDQFFTVYPSARRPRDPNHHWNEQENKAFQVNPSVTKWLAEVPSRPTPQDNDLDIGVRRILGNVLVAEPAGRIESSEIHKQLLEVLKPPVIAQARPPKPRSFLKTILPGSSRPTRPPSSPGLPDRASATDNKWRLRVSPKPELTKCAASPQNSHLVFLSEEVVEIFEVCPSSRRNTVPVARVGIEHFGLGANAYWHDCCLNQRYLFLVPRADGPDGSVEFKASNVPSAYRAKPHLTVLQLIVYPLQALREGTPAQLAAQGIYIAVEWDNVIDCIAAASSDDTLLACTVIDPISTKKDWAVMLLRLTGLPNWLEAHVSLAPSSAVMSHAPSASPTYHNEACEDVKEMLASPRFLGIPDDEPFMRPYELQFSPSGTYLNLTTALTETKETHVWWWKIQRDGDATFYGHQAFGNKGAKDVNQPAYTSATIAHNATVLLVLRSWDVYMRTPVPDAGRNGARRYIEDYCNLGKSVRKVLVLDENIATHALLVGESKSKRHKVAVFRRELVHGTSFERNPQHQDLARTSEIKIGDLLNKQALVLLCRASEWYGSQGVAEAWVVVIVTYDGLMEALDVPLPS